MLTAWTGHGTIVNTAALRRLDVRDDELDPPGGYFGRMPDGKTLTGVAHEYAEYPLGQRFCMEPPAPSQLASFKGYATEAATFGITTVQVMTTRYPSVKLASILEHGDVPVRLRLIDFPMIAMSAWPAPASRSATVASNRLRVSGTKWILDGTPIERAMLLREPYADAPQTRGRANFSATDLRQFLTRALEAREQPLLHAVGDGAIGQALDALEATGGERWQPLRPRLEHADLFAAADFARAKQLGVVIVQNPSHFMIPTLSARLGAERMAHVQQVRAIVEAGIPFAIGSDGPMNPFLNMMFAAINPTNHAQALSIEQSLTAYTRGSAYAESTESEKGTIAPGMIADLAMLSQDIFRVPLDALPATTSVLTLVGGTVVHSR
jgi:hypothetical protein